MKRVVFGGHCLRKALVRKVKHVMEGKKSKNRATIAFLVNASGQSDSLPIVIWKSENPRCFKGVNKAKLPVQYYSQQKAWMTSEIMRHILKTQNRKLKLANRSVLLLLDNAGCHPPDVKDCYTNIKVVFLPPNTTSRLQPLDLGIIKNFKVYYRKLLLSYIVTKMDEHLLASEVANKVDILQAMDKRSMGPS